MSSAGIRLSELEAVLVSGYDAFISLCEGLLNPFLGPALHFVGLAAYAPLDGTSFSRIVAGCIFGMFLLLTMRYVYRVCAIYLRYTRVKEKDPDKILDDPTLRAMRRALLIADLKHHRRGFSATGGSGGEGRS